MAKQMLAQQVARLVHLRVRRNANPFARYVTVPAVMEVFHAGETRQPEYQ
jgi:ribonuclease D